MHEGAHCYPPPPAEYPLLLRALALRADLALDPGDQDAQTVQLLLLLWRLVGRRNSGAVGLGCGIGCGRLGSIDPCSVDVGYGEMIFIS